MMAGMEQFAEYFAAERQGGFLLVGLGAASLSFATFLWLTRSAFSGMAWPLLVFGVFQSATAVVEAQRMDVVHRNFRIVKRVEMVLIGAGLALVVLLPVPGTWSAVGLGLLVEGSVLLVFDVFAQHRASLYTQWLGNLIA